jgi:hypothetical protein
VVGLTRRERNGVPFYTFDVFDGFPALAAVVTTRQGGESSGAYTSLNLGGKTGDDPEAVRRNRARAAALVGSQPERLVFGRQVHQATVAVVPRDHPGGAFADTDALATDAPGIPLVILTADCAAVFLFDPVRPAVGIAHAGWRGTVAGVVASTVARMGEAFGSSPADLFAGVGPSIGPCCYEVGEDVAGAVEEAFPDDTDELLLEPDMASAGSFRAAVNEGRRHFDLWLAIEISLLRAGLRAERIETARLCTACRTDQFFSHRAEKGVTGRFGGIVMLA